MSRTVAFITGASRGSGATEWHGKMVNAQRLCKRLGLVPGWPRPRAST